MLCAIWYDICNLKNVKNNYGGMLLLVELQASPSSVGVFSRFLNCTNDTTSRKTSHILIIMNAQISPMKAPPLNLLNIQFVSKGPNSAFQKLQQLSYHENSIITDTALAFNIKVKKESLNEL